MAEKQNPIACEPCRQKKCKCDRILPVCSQCIDPVRCIYPESGKRGLPQGYISHVENRLAATERALYSVYAYLRTVSPHTITTITTIVNSSPETPSRTAAIAEWTRLPLSDRDDLERWWTEKARLYGMTEGEVSSDWSPASAKVSTTERDATSGPIRMNSQSQSQSRNNHTRDVPHRQPVRNPREGRAERLAELESAIYF